MAVEAVVALMLDKLGKLKEAPLLGVGGEIKHIQRELDKLRCFLKDADIKQKKDENVREWMEGIRDICFDVDDVIDIVGQGQAAQGRHGFVERLKRSISDRITRHKVGKEIERIKLNIEGISRSGESYGITGINEERRDATSSTQRLQEVERRPISTEKIEIVIPTVDDQLTNEERTEDIDGGRQKAIYSSRNLQEQRRVSTLPGEPEEVGLREEINKVGQQLIEEKPRLCDVTRDISEGERGEVGSQEGINTASKQLIKEKEVLSPCDDGTRDFDIDIDEGIQEAGPSRKSSSIRDLQQRRRFLAPFEYPEVVGQQEEISTTSDSEAVVSYIVGKLGDLLIQEAQLLFGVREGVEWIKNELEWMQCFLKDADSKKNRDARVKKWVSDIIDVSYEIEDVIETFIDRQKRRHGLVERVKRGISKPNTRHEVGKQLEQIKQKISNISKRRETYGECFGKQIEQIKQKISDISKRRETYGISDINEGRQQASSSRQSLEEGRRFSALLEEPEVVGQQEEICSLKKQLINGEQRRCVISLFGMGGSGKTTLARKVYHDVKNDFDCHAFICLSQQYEMKEVLIRLITCAMGKLRGEIENLTTEELGMMLREHLKGKRYLVVIDDIWSIKAWDNLKLILPDTGQSKSRVMLTTRIKDVALHADPSGHHDEVCLLNDDESWELFIKKIFPGEDPSTACPSNLEETGRKILTKCGRLPLAILVLGGLLAIKDKTERTWSKVLESIPESSKQCMEILALSYLDLPHHLKPCFLYVGLFPEDYEISSGKLIRLWIAEGFIRWKGNKVMEDVAEAYLEELVSRSMIQVASKRSNGSIHKCRIHELFRELSITIARENNFFTVQNDTSSSSTSSVRRLAVYRNIDGDETKNHSMETLHSILYFFDSAVDVLKLPNTSSKLLRVMNVESEKLSGVPLPKGVTEFVHLKFLEISINYRLRGSPPSIGNLSSLQSLKVTLEDPEKKNLPNTIWNLKELRHLHAYSHIEGHPHLSNLTNLQTLSLMAGSWIEEGLGKLTNLRKLKIHTDLSSYHRTLPYCIEKLRNLRSLQLVENWNGGGEFPPLPPFLPFTHHQDLYKLYLKVCIQKLPELPPNLVELYLTSSELKPDAISTLENLQHLKILTLLPRSYLGKRMICSSGGFPRLEFLELQKLPLEEWIVEEGAMISLKSVKLIGMSELKTDTLPERVRGLLEEGELLEARREAEHK